MYDVVVVGCGPAGAMAVKRCTELGLKVLGLEKYPLPRHKPCAGVLYPRVLEDFNIDEKTVASQVIGVKIVAPNETYATVEFPEPGAVVYRKKFDYTLVKKAVKAGGIVSDNSKVLAVHQSKNICRVLLENKIIEAKYVIAADGVYSIVARSTGKPWSKENLAITIQAYLKVSPKDKKTIGKYFEVHYNASTTPGGWTWIAEREKDIVVGLGYPLKYLKTGKELKEKLQAFIEKRFEEKQIIKLETYMLPITGPKNPEDLTVGNIVFTGDAGGFIRSDTGEGIYYAMHSGLAAAETIHEAINTKTLLKETYLAKIEDHGLKHLYQQTELKTILLDNNKIEKYVKKLQKLSKRFK